MGETIVRVRHRRGLAMPDGSIVVATIVRWQGRDELHLTWRRGGTCESRNAWHGPGRYLMAARTLRAWRREAFREQAWREYAGTV